MSQPGWYQDPAGGPSLRWWDGGQWTARQCAAPEAWPGVPGAVAQDPAPGEGVLAAAGPVEPAVLFSPELHSDLFRHQQEITVPPATFQQSPPAAAPMPNRRKFLWIAGIGVAGLAAVGGVAAVALTRDSTHGGNAASTPPTGAPVPNGPAPTWTQALDNHFNNGDRSGGLGVMGGVLVRWDNAMAQAFDTKTGAPRWTGRPDLPAGYSGFSWIGLNDSLLIGATQDAETNSSLVFAIGSDGKQQFSHDVGRNAHGMGFTQVFDFDGINVLLGTRNEIVAIEVSSGKQLWRRALTAYNRASAVIGGQRCYLQDYTATLCLDMTTGNQLWATPNTCTANGASSIVSVADVLAIAGERLVVLDTVTGTQRQTVLQASTSIRGVGVAADLLIVGEETETASGDNDYTAWGINPRDGSKVWATPIQRLMATSLTTSADLVLVPTQAESGATVRLGIVVLDGKTGTIAWAESGSAINVSAGGIADWLACATPDAVYAASSTTVCAYPRHP
ncbi:PQQ-binding-like beta-propeller repeat protein [Amycolatopsis rhizosphaerae]|uniref:outer membrane protein assembly factor BamB family protein n=1 Tax=Amycolatopsis rhizosphaerae TaxID=2053003 RepID=UPI0016437952|nr:PQQ-binding-like beta-propeller repeat protein [Amycolatopsis rhizosphaerae]